MRCKNWQASSRAVKCQWKRPITQSRNSMQNTNKTRNLWIIVAMTVLNAIGMTIVFPLFPFLVGKYLPEAQVAIGLSSLNSVYAFCQFLASPLFGALSDHFGRKPILISLSARIIVFRKAHSALRAKTSQPVWALQRCLYTQGRTHLVGDGCFLCGWAGHLSVQFQHLCQRCLCLGSSLYMSITTRRSMPSLLCWQCGRW